ncbi:MAG: hypothetical protein AABX51_07530 [Nanoarchaeota archaeon]
MKKPSLHPNTIAGIGLILTVVSVIFYYDNPLFFVFLFAASLAADLLTKKMRKSEKYVNQQSIKLADWTADRLGEAVLFSIAWFPWLFLFIINCFLTLYSFLKKDTIILPLRQIFFVYFIALHIFKPN